MAQKLALSLIATYKGCVSPFLPHVCRFVPSCSTYASQCFRKFNFTKAVKLTLRRLSRCHPFCPGGFDPIPE